MARLVLNRRHAVHFPTKQGRQQMKFAKSPIALGALALFAAAPMAAHAVTVTWKAPSSGSVLSNVNWFQSSACEVSGTGISRVQFVLVNSSGQTINLNNDTSAAFRCNLVSTNYPNGNYTLRAVAYDSAGNQASSSRSITIKNTTTDAKPTISFSAPANNATISGLTTCRVNASDDRGIARVQFFVDGTLLSTDTSSSYTCTLDNKKYKNGAHTLVARVTDTAGLTAQSQITFNVSGGISSTTGNTPPILSIDAPAAGSTLGGSVPFAATATDAGGSVAKIEMYLVSGTTQKLVAADTTSPYSGSFSTAGVPDGAAQLMAVATDNLGAKSTVQRSVTIKNGSTTPTDPAPTDPAPSAIAPSDIITRDRKSTRL